MTFLLNALLVLVAVFVVIYMVRRFLIRAEDVGHYVGSFSGEVYHLGRAYASVRRAQGKPRASVICFPGLMVDQVYFQGLYEDSDLELIWITASNCHLPVQVDERLRPEWGRKNPNEPGTIAYDAHALLLALKNLVTTPQVRIHAVSRGCAVVLEAGKQDPDAFAEASGKHVECVLEAPVLPGSRVLPPLSWLASPLMIWLIPLLLPLGRLSSAETTIKRVFPPVNEQKLKVAERFLYVLRTPEALMITERDLMDWMTSRDTSLLAHLNHVCVLSPLNDCILDVERQRELLHSAPASWNIIEVPEASHMVIFDAPEVLPPLPDQTQA